MRHNIPIYFFLIIISSFLFVGCPPNGPEQPIIKVNPTNITFQENENSKQITISNIGKGVLEWNIHSPKEDWLSIDGNLSGSIRTESAVRTLNANRNGKKAGEYNTQFNITSNGGDEVVNVTMKVVSPPTITTTPLPDGTVDDPYSVTLEASGGTTPYTWSLESGSLPPELSLSNNGTISGTPTTAGTYTFTVKVTDSGNPSQTATKEFTLKINPPIPAITTTSPLLDGISGSSYSFTLSATGGTGSYTWDIISGSLHPDLILNSSTGVISGTPTTTGTYKFTVRVTSGSQSDTKDFSISIYDVLTITTSSPLPDRQIDVAYSVTLSATGGKQPHIWSLESGSLPSGLSFNSSGVISGTPTTAGTYTFTVKVTDSGSYSPDGNPQTVTKQFTIKINPILSITTNSSLLDGVVGSPYSETLEASGGTTPYTWSLESGSLPPGLSLSSNGTISGTPTTADSYPFTVKVTDSGNPAQNATKEFTLKINPPILKIITSTPLPDGTVGDPYSETLEASGGTTPYTWSLQSGSLPPGLSLNSSTGVISGISITAGTYIFTVKVTDSGNPAQTATKDLSIKINPADQLVIDNVWLQLTKGPSLSGSQFHVKVYANLEDWDENTLIWTTRPNFRSSIVDGEDHFYSTSDFKITHLRDLVKDWIEGNITNYGIVIIPTLSDISGQEWFLFRDKEFGNHPTLHIIYIYGGTTKEIDLKPTDDVYISDGSSSNKDGDGLFIGTRGSPVETCWIYLKYNLNINW